MSDYAIEVKDVSKMYKLFDSNLDRGKDSLNKKRISANNKGSQQHNNCFCVAVDMYIDLYVRNKSRFCKNYNGN